MKKLLAKLLLLVMIFNLLPVFNVNNSFAVDGDGTADIDLTVSSSVIASTIIGRNFSMDISLKNESSSEGDAYNPGFLIKLPENVAFVSSASLGSPTRTINYGDGTSLLFFEKTDLLVKSTTNNYSINLESELDAALFTATDIGVLAYVEDNIYGRGAVPTGAPGGTLPGGVDLSNGNADATDLSFPDNILIGTDLSGYTFNNATTRFVPYDVKKQSEGVALIGKPIETTLTIYGNDLGNLEDFHIEDVIPNNRKFVGFTQTGSVGNINVQYNTPTNGEVTLDLDNIDVGVGTNLEIKYQTLPLAFPISSYTGSNILHNTGSVIDDRTSSINTATMLADGTWNNGVTDLPITATGVITPQDFDAKLGYAILGKSVNKSSPVKGETVRYTITVDLARNVSFGTGGGSGTYIKDILPDGLTFISTVSSSNSGIGNSLTQETPVDIDGNGDTTITWTLNSGEINADDTITITYDALVDGVFEGLGEQEYENTESLTNTATFVGTITDSNNDEEWGYTAPSKIGTTVEYTATSTITAPEPTNEKRLISIELPNATIYNAGNPLPANTAIPVGSKLTFAAIMDFPNVVSTGAIVRDALPLLTGPNESVYDIAFQTNNSLRDINNNLVPVNDDDGDGNADTVFNTLTLSGTTMPNSSWVQTTPANNIDFHLGNGDGKKTFSILFTVDVLPLFPSDYNNEGYLPEKNVLIASFEDDGGTINNLSIQEVPFDIALPAVEITKSVTASNVESNSFVDYSVTISNTGKADAYLENLIDTLPDNLTFTSGDITGVGFTVTSTGMTQAGNDLTISFNTGATLGRSVLPSETSVNINYTVQAGTGILISNTDKTNTVTTDYFSYDNTPSTGVYNFGPVTDDANFRTRQPTITRTLISTTEAGSTGASIEIGEEATFETIINLPGGVYNSSSFIDTSNSDLQFINATVVSASGSLSFSTGTGFTSNTATFGTITNSDTDNGTTENIVIHSTYRSKTSATNGSKYTRGRFYYSGTNVYRNSNVSVTQPNIVLNKSVLPTSGDAGDTLTYTVSLNNTGNANAYDLVLNDTLDPRFTFATGTLNLDGFSGTEEEFLSSTGITLGELENGSTKSLSFDVIVNDNVAPNDSIPNRVDLTYDSLTADDSVNEKDYSTNSTVNFTVTNITIDHEITSTTNPDTGTSRFNGSLNDINIGEEVIYKTTLNIPEATYTGMTVSQLVPSGFKFLSGSIAPSTLTHSLSGITISPDFRTITYTLGDVTNPGSGGSKTLDLYSQLIVVDTSGPTAGQEKGLSTVTAEWSGIHSATDSTNLDIVEPNLVITKDYSISTGDGGDTAVTTITIQNTGSAPAYDLERSDIQPGKVTTTGANFKASSTGAVLNPGASITYTYNTTLNSSVTTGEILTGTATVDYTSAPLTNADERSYSSTNSDTIQVVVPGGLIATLDTVQNVKIGDVSSYTIRVPVAEGTTNTLRIEDAFPDGIVVNTGSITVSSSGGIVYSGSNTPVITSTGMVWSYTGVINSNSDNGVTEYITINFDTVLLNTSDNDAGDSRVHNAKAIYNGGDEKTAATNSIVVIEPNITVDILNTFTQATKLVKYTFSLTNNGTSVGYDLDLETLLPSGVTYTGSINITNAGGSTNLQKVSNNFTVEELAINTGSPLTFEIYAEVDGTQSLGDVLTLTGNLEYTSQAGTYTSVIPSNSDNTERSGVGFVNDHFDTDTTNFTYQNAILDEAISVVDDNGGSHLGGEVYTYTTTLTNSGNVALSGIPVTIDIPNYLSGSTFVLQSIPGGSADTYSSTGGVNSNGQLVVTGISIPVGESRTIVYKVNTLVGTPDGTNIDTTAVVGNSVEGAIGGTPNVDFDVVAPNLETTSVEVDDNAGDLYKLEYITHTNTIKNIGSSTGTNLQVELLYNTGTVTYQSGSLEFASGSLVNTGSIVINEIEGKITFSIVNIGTGVTETVVFKSQATGNAGDTVETIITGEIDEGFTSTTTSNELIIVDEPVVSSGGGGGGGGGIRTCSINMLVCKQKLSGAYVWYRKDGVGCNGGYLGKTCNSDENPDEEATEKPQEKEDPKKEDIEKPKEEVKKVFEDIEKKKKLLEEILEGEEKSGETLLKALPKILPKTGTPINTRVSTKYNSKVNTSLPDESNFKLAGSKDMDMNYWMESLPEQDKNKGKYIVIPSNGLVVPINTITKSDTNFDEMINGREVEVNDYLKDGVLEYPGTSTKGYGELGNKVVFGHSSYWNDDDGRYQTHFQKIIELDENEEVRVYEKDSKGDYKMYKYIVTESYNTPKTDTSVLTPGKGKNLTLFTCTPIGGTAGRWIIKAKYVEEVIEELNREIYFTDVSIKYKKIVNNIMKRITSIKDSDKRESALYSVYNKVEAILIKYESNEKITRIFEFLRYEISKELIK